MKFQIEQVALYPPSPEKAIKLLKEMGAEDWARDHVVAKGRVYAQKGLENEANLAFNYDMLTEANELEVLEYTDGDNWMRYNGTRVSHLGMHCSEEELDEWKEFFKARNIDLAQEVHTSSHTNPVIKGKRLYHYAIFDTFPILSVDIKFIVRRDV